jgi:lysophospholipase L1-like esterase
VSNDSFDPEGQRLALPELSSRLEAIARAALVPDLLGGIWGRPSLMADGIHPNKAGYAVMAESVRKAAEPLVKAEGGGT